MKKKAAGVLAALGVLAVPATILFSGGESVSIDEVRAARLSACPPEEEIADKCPAGVRQFKDFCLCLTNKETVTDEETTVPFDKRKRLVVCEVVDEETEKVHVVSRFESTSTSIKPTCRLVADNVRLPGISMHNVESGIEDALRAACAPCPIAADSWGPCPQCIWDNTCMEKCFGL